MGNELNAKARVVTLLVTCPSGQRNHDCAVGGLRVFPAVDVINFINELTEEKLNVILTKHKLCVAMMKSRLTDITTKF
jgi:hypothetical protein